ncbi:unnamed protein product [Ectocarpus sp. 4 AP-2014]
MAMGAGGEDMHTAAVVTRFLSSRASEEQQLNMFLSKRTTECCLPTPAMLRTMPSATRGPAGLSLDRGRQTLYSDSCLLRPTRPDACRASHRSIGALVAPLFVGKDGGSAGPNETMLPSAAPAAAAAVAAPVVWLAKIKLPHGWVAALLINDVQPEVQSWHQESACGPRL